MRNRDRCGNQEMVIVFAAGNAGPCADESKSRGVHGNRFPGIGEKCHHGGRRRQCPVTFSGQRRHDPPTAVMPALNRTRTRPARTTWTATRVADRARRTNEAGPGSARGAHYRWRSAEVSAASIRPGLGSALECFDASGVCALSGSGTNNDIDNFFPIDQQFYTESSGTSHSTPVVSGACALMRQFFINNDLDCSKPRDDQGVFDEFDALPDGCRERTIRCGRRARAWAR